MEITGTVARVTRRRTDHGSSYITVQLSRPGTHARTRSEQP